MTPPAVAAACMSKVLSVLAYLRHAGALVEVEFSKLFSYAQFRMKMRKLSGKTLKYRLILFRAKKRTGTHVARKMYTRCFFRAPINFVYFHF